MIAIVLIAAVVRERRPLAWFPEGKRPRQAARPLKNPETLAAAAIVKIVPENLVAEWASNGKKTIPR
jgi:hypothetical protein